MSAPDFDYHLPPSDQAAVEKLVPLHQAKIQLAFRANFSLDDKKYKEGAIAISEHMIVFAKKKMLGKGFSCAGMFHVFDLTALSTKTDYKFSLEAKDSKASIHTGIAMRAARTILRNYLISTPLYPQPARISFTTHNQAAFPQFDPKSSPSQDFQFAYYASCSYFDCTYYHEAVRLYHTLLSTSNGVMELNQLPLSLLEGKNEDQISLQAVFYALRYNPFVFALCCSDVSRPDLISSAAQLLSVNTKIKAISFENCSIQTGAVELAQAVQSNKHMGVSYWSLADNPFDDLTPLMAAFLLYSTPVFYFNFGGCDMSSEATELLVKALAANKNLWNLQYLIIPGSKIGKSAAVEFAKHIKNLSERGMHSLKYLELGLIDSGSEQILEALAQYPQPLVSLKLANTKIKAQTLRYIISLITTSETLAELDISGSGLTPEEISPIISAFSNNRNLKNIKLWLGDLKLNGKRLIQLAHCFSHIDGSIFSMLALEDNDMDVSDLKVVLKMLQGLPRLSVLRIGKNFSKSMDGLEDNLIHLLDFASLMGISIAGDKSHYCGKALLPFLEALQSNKTLKSLDIRGQRIEDEGIKALTKVVRGNPMIGELKYDGSCPNTVESLYNLLDALSFNETITSCKLPTNDIFSLVEEVPKAKRSDLMGYISKKEEIVQFSLMKNRARFGVHSILATKNIKSLDEMIDDLTVGLVGLLAERPVNVHSQISSILGLPLPYEDGNTKVEEEDGEKDEYGVGGKQVVEVVQQSMQDLQTLQFNSLCIRRPQIASVMSASGSISNFKVDEESNEEEAEEEEKSYSARRSIHAPKSVTSKVLNPSSISGLKPSSIEAIEPSSIV